MTALASRVKSGAVPGRQMHVHFSRLASVYNGLRTTDAAPVRIIAKTLAGQRVERCVDVGCGSGRYSLLLMSAFPGLHVTCCDINRAMLDEAGRYLSVHGQTRFDLRLADAESLRLSDARFDFIASFNAIHHFDPVAFLARAAGLLGRHGKIFLYTRLHEQNAETIWGRYFPGFLDRERRLYRTRQIRGWLHKLDRLELREIRLVQHRRSASLARLVELARCQHYSTFEYYTEEELSVALEVFRRRIRRRFAETARVEWREGNAMIILQAAGGARRRARRSEGGSHA